jgi:hypothetical protein
LTDCPPRDEFVLRHGDPHRHGLHRIALACLTLAAGALAGGCVETTSTGGSGLTRSRDASSPLGSNPTQISTIVARVQASLAPMGAIPYDNFTLPLVDPNGRYVATEAGIAPYESTALAAEGAPVPEATRVEIYRIDPVEREPVQQSVLAEPAILGRSCDVAGVLVEAQRHDGSRWIGRADWETANIDWLVADGSVNAFAHLGPRGQLAWSRRNAQGTFDLVVRRADGTEWSLSSQGDDWILPTWSGRDDGLFLVRLNEGRMDLIHGQATSGTTFRQSLTPITIANNARVRDAYQMMIVQPGSFAGRTNDHPEQLVFHHPLQRRAAVWRPNSLVRGGLSFFLERSYTALMDEPNLALVATDKDLWRASLLDKRHKAKLLGGLCVPRPTDREDMPFVLLTPQEGRIDLLGMDLLTPEEAERATASAE